MDNVLTLALILTLLCLSAVCIYLITVLVRARDVLTSMERDVREMSIRAIPVLDNLEYITARVKSISDSVDDQVLMIRDSIGSVKEVTDSIVALERKVQDRIEGPILDSIAFVAAVVKGVRTFLDRVRS